MYRYSLNQILVFSSIVWTIFIAVSFLLSPGAIFHIINPLSIALGVVLILVYGEGLIDALRYREDGITLPHLLTFGVVLNWFGMIMRMARWYFTGQHPAVQSGMDFWFYNFGLWISIWAGLFLIGAAGIAVKPYKFTTLFVIFILVAAALGFVDFAHLHYAEMQEHIQFIPN